MLSILKYIAGTILIWLRRCSLRRYFRTIEGSTSGARFSKVPKSFHTRLSRSKISNLITWEQFYAHIININRGSLLTRSFRRLHLSVFKYRLNKNGFAGAKTFRGFRETDPCTSYARFITRTVFNHQSKRAEITTYIDILVDRKGMSTICSSTIFSKRKQLKWISVDHRVYAREG